ncbi:MAG: hypothetical protein RM338_12670 [Nostoc sp. DedQUE12a]|nr:hypothetical protein [Nostoc sp. DedQUE12a]
MTHRPAIANSTFNAKKFFAWLLFECINLQSQTCNSVEGELSKANQQTGETTFNTLYRS